MIHRCHIQLHSAKDLGDNFDNPIFFVPFELNLIEVEAFHDEDTAREEDDLDHEGLTQGTHIWAKSGNRYVIDTPFQDFRKLYRDFWRDLLTSPDIDVHFQDRTQEKPPKQTRDPKP